MLVYTITIDENLDKETAYDFDTAVAYIVEQTGLDEDYVSQELNGLTNFPKGDSNASVARHICGDLLVHVHIFHVPDQTLPQQRQKTQTMTKLYARTTIERLLGQVDAAREDNTELDVILIREGVVLVTQLIAMNAELLDTESKAFARARAAQNMGRQFPIIKASQPNAAFIALELLREAIEELI